MESSGRTLVCSIVFLDIVEYSKKSVAEQLELKQAFNRILADALAQVAPRDRVVLDTGDGAAVTFLGDPEDALFAAASIRDAVRTAPPGTLRVRMGVNLGPVRLVRDINDQMNIIGDGINVAQRVMTFAQAGQLLVSRSFYEVVSCLSLDYASLFSYVGSRTDKHVREHEVYSVSEDLHMGGANLTGESLLEETPPELGATAVYRKPAQEEGAPLVPVHAPARVIDAGQGVAIAGAVLDVFRQEPLPAEHPFWTTEGILVLPHIGGPHPQRDRIVARLFVDNPGRFLDGKPLKEVVDRQAGY